MLTIHSRCKFVLLLKLMFFSLSQSTLGFIWPGSYISTFLAEIARDQHVWTTLQIYHSDFLNFQHTTETIAKACLPEIHVE